MSGYIVFVRFFINHPPNFPFERFQRLGDDEIEAETEALNRERRRGRRRQEAGPGPRYTVEEWNSAGLLAPNGGGHTRAPHEPTPPPAQPTDGITRRYPVRRFGKKKLARTAAEALQAKVSELGDAALDKPDWNDGGEEQMHVTRLLATANPRFSVVAEKELSPAELAVAMEKMRRLSSPAGKNLSQEEALLRFYLTMLQPTLEQIGDAEGPARGERLPPRSQPMRTAASDDSDEPEPTFDDLTASPVRVMNAVLNVRIVTDKPTPEEPPPGGWSRRQGVQAWANVFNVSRATMRTMLAEQRVRNMRYGRQSYAVAIDDIPAEHRARFRPTK